MEIDTYEFGNIVVDGKPYNADIILLRDEVLGSWWRREGHALHIEDLDEIMKSNPEIIVIGTGYYGNMRIPAQTRQFLENRGIRLLAYPTGKAVEEYNRLQRHCADIVAGLHLTC